MGREVHNSRVALHNPGKKKDSTRDLRPYVRIVRSTELKFEDPEQMATLVHESRNPYNDKLSFMS